jgi:hypothetical protein
MPTMRAPSNSETPPSGENTSTSCPRLLSWRTVSLSVVTMPSILGTKVSVKRAMRIVVGQREFTEFSQR